MSKFRINRDYRCLIGLTDTWQQWAYIASPEAISTPPRDDQLGSVARSFSGLPAGRAFFRMKPDWASKLGASFLAGDVLLSELDVLNENVSLLDGLDEPNDQTIPRETQGQDETITVFDANSSNVYSKYQGFFGSPD